MIGLVDRTTIQGEDPCAARRCALREYDAATPVNGCAECGRLPEQHGKVHGHTWDAPTDRLRLARLRARREMKGQR